MFADFNLYGGLSSSEEGSTQLKCLNECTLVIHQMYADRHFGRMSESLLIDEVINYWDQMHEVYLHFLLQIFILPIFV